VDDQRQYRRLRPIKDATEVFSPRVPVGFDAETMLAACLCDEWECNGDVLSRSPSTVTELAAQVGDTLSQTGHMSLSLRKFLDPCQAPKPALLPFRAPRPATIPWSIPADAEIFDSIMQESSFSLAQEEYKIAATFIEGGQDFVNPDYNFFLLPPIYRDEHEESFIDDRPESDLASDEDFWSESNQECSAEPRVSPVVLSSLWKSTVVQ
jgi:hypothetical protein